MTFFQHFTDNIAFYTVAILAVYFATYALTYLSIFVVHYLSGGKLKFPRIIRQTLTFPISLFLAVSFCFFIEKSGKGMIPREQWDGFAKNVLAILLILSSSFLIFRCGKLVFSILKKKQDISNPNNLRQRKALTQIQYIEKFLSVLLFTITCSLILLRFEVVAKLGGGLLASAGIASVVVGFAAQESVSNLIAGFQIAFTQPFRIDDAVVVEGEWGWIEEINLTYVVVRIWDRRRLILPIKYFSKTPFQNWTRNSGQIIGSIIFYLDHKAPIPMIREAYEKFVTESELWDGDVNILQTIDSTEKTLELRGLVSSSSSPDAWDLRCEVREKVFIFIAENCPEALPRHRMEYAKLPGAEA